ncbi:HEAT repeat protein [Paenibacillus cellulosilyticus]|uniref:HEAT repeat protein n=1 Tax=Paenibacillus cellulosilyticus TaxID=375489 RepID=A0A2V2YUX2_9BACL|nr:HEAT repeat domain-containing protein [Paenibacillus cellulosilyticus]PWW04836.1 HEAT repeat protein [Paenibacillus cellulosilyticus]QKS45950.1 HEAT repeat domain-containing protein [Paenibacillus cellulosilyticus]
MSVELLQDLQHEVRRLFIAGSALAQGDVRLAKLQPQLKKLGEAAPVFNRIAEASDAVLNASREDSAVKLLELSKLLSAVLHTQGKTETAGDRQPIPSLGIALSTDVPYRRLKPLLEQLTTKGQGRLEQLRHSILDNSYLDLRAMPVMCSALDETYPEIADLIAETIATGYGQKAVSVLQEQINLQGGKGDVRRLKLLHRLIGDSAEELVLDAAVNGAVDIKVAAIEMLSKRPQHEMLLLELSRDKRKEVRQAALDTLASIGTKEALDRLQEALSSKDRELAIEPIRRANSTALLGRIIAQAERSFDQFAAAEGKERSKLAEQLHAELLCLHGSGSELIGAGPSWKRHVTVSPASVHIAEDVIALLRRMLTTPGFFASETEVLQENAAELLLSLNTEEANRFLLSLDAVMNTCMAGYLFRAGYRLLTPTELFDRFSGVLANPSSIASKEIIRAVSLITQEQLSAVEEDEDLIVPANSWDSRWVHTWVQADSLELVLLFTQTEDAQVTTYLTSKLTKNARLHDSSIQRILITLFRIRYTDAPQLLFQLMEARSFYYMDAPLRKLIASVPRSYIPRLRAIAEKHPYNANELTALADAMEAAPAEIIEESGTA